MKIKRQNCWEYRNCGREPGGKEADDFGICPAASDNSYNGINGGKNGGRICWAVSGTLCEGKTQGSYVDKRADCMTCPFFKLVRKDEGRKKLNGKFLKFITHEDRHSAFSKMTHRLIRAGERFVTQGEIENKAYIIQSGTCLVIVEKNGKLHPVDHYGEGDIVGGVGLLTGEPRIAHVEAETDVEVWVLEKSQFDDIAAKDHEVRTFLTEVISNRFDSRRPTAYRTIGKYVATDIIGRGGYSIVYKGLHKTLNMPVAIKMMRHDMAMDSDFLSRFHHEAKTIAGLNHPNIIKIYDIEERYQTVFIIMELMEDWNLELR